MSVRDFNESHGIEQISDTKIAAVKVLESVFDSGINSSNIDKCLDVSKKIIELVKVADFVDSIKNFKDFSSPLLAHSFLVSLFSVMTCQRMQWNTERTLSAVAVGGLLHNIGLSTLPEHLQILDPHHLNSEEQQLYKDHPEKGMALLGRLPQIPAAVLQIVLQHHELNGHGYPLELSLSKMSGLANHSA
jgi:HD-GYP domain-containing protein (c-di-GMP phosphodiesterase class II)